MDKAKKARFIEVLRRRKAMDKSKVALPSPQELDRMKVEDMLLFNSRYGSFGSEK